MKIPRTKYHKSIFDTRDNLIERIAKEQGWDQKDIAAIKQIKRQIDELEDRCLNPDAIKKIVNIIVEQNRK